MAAEYTSEDLSPGVRELVTAVRERASRMASPQEIERLGAEAARRARGNPQATKEARELWDVAMSSGREMVSLLDELVALAGGGAGGSPQNH